MCRRAMHIALRFGRNLRKPSQSSRRGLDLATNLWDGVRCPGSARAGSLFESGEQCHPLVGHRGGLLQRTSDIHWKTTR